MKKIFSLILTLCIITSTMYIVPITANAEFMFGFYYTVTNMKATITDISPSLGVNVTIPKRLGDYIVTRIGNEAFCDYDDIKSITIPDSVIGIGASAFSGCTNLTNITIPNNITSIDVAAFQNCSNLTNVTISNNVTNISASVFQNCANLTSVTIPYSVTNIGVSAFSGCTGLTNITIPDSTTNIDMGAFYKCTNLTNVYYTGTEEQWNNITIGTNNKPLTNATIHFNYIPTEVSATLLSATSTPTSITTLSQANITGEPEITTFGTVFIPLALFANPEAKTATVEYDNSIYNIKDGQKFDATLANIPESCKDMPIVAMSYIGYNGGEFAYSDAKYMSVNDTTLNNVE